MAIGRAERRNEREPRIVAVFGTQAPVALDLLELVELAWHDCYGEVTPSAEVIEDMLTLSGGDVSMALTGDLGCQFSYSSSYLALRCPSQPIQ